MELNIHEQFLIYSLRTFRGFLKNYRFHSMTYNDRDGDYLCYKSYKGDRMICIFLSHQTNGYLYNIRITKTHFLVYNSKKYFSMPEIFKYFPEYSDVTPEITEQNIQEKIEKYLEFMKAYLIPVIKGDLWIDEILEQIKTRGKTLNCD